MKRVLLGMSGGVDSSAAALLLRRQGYEVTGATLWLWSDPGSETAAGQPDCGPDCEPESVLEARRVAGHLGIDHLVFDFRDAFRRLVVAEFIREYSRGRTPNPCVTCNREIKFKLLLERALAMGFDSIATGHYARIEKDERDGLYHLRRGIDPRKDQAYVLYRLTQEQLAHTLLPLGTWTKDKVRDLAAANGLVNAAKPDSQEICFIDKRGYQAFLERESAGGTPGNFLGRDGRIIGRHRGISHYTVGQRKGLGIAGLQPVFVTSIEPADNAIRLGNETDLYSSGLLAEQVHWISGDPLACPRPVEAKIRYQSPLAAAIVEPAGPAPDCVTVSFAKPQRAVAPGQSVVFYNGGEVLGGGRIQSSWKGE
ncbi:MAG TPA: tRNA 2-thiouridine(34) synthase MnmA [Clostridiales bacterium]|nr:tRNA 2-thiouridine(34) synthase MnmA [Clostridiales bacterium]